MLDKNSLSQLKQLKKEIKDSKEYAVGKVKTTQRKFGFVVADDGREIYLSPDEMQNVLPGDQVRILVITEIDKNKPDAKPKVSGTVEKVQKSELTTFTGRYVVRGQGHFVEPDLHLFNRWIFIPPKARNKAKPGDFIRCKLSRHPFPSGKAQANILEVIGAPEKAGIEADYIISKFQLAPTWPQDWQQQINTLAEGERADLTATPFVTIDATTTQDMDDALYVETTEDGWQLQVAIADPDALIQRDSSLDKIARQRASTSYLPGRAVSMLPPELANQRCSLAASERRAALVCSIELSQDGAIKSYDIKEAIVSSQAKLSYDGVARLLESESKGEADADNPCTPYKDLLLELQALTNALLNKRKQDHLIIPNREEYRLVLNQQGKLEKIERQQKNGAFQLVEECMVAANRCAADMLGDQGLFIAHPGFRQERLPDVRKLADEQLGLKDIDYASPEGYRQLMNAIDDDALSFPLRAVLSRLLERSRLSRDASPHYGMGLPSYTTFTSPIRKYSDLLVQRMIKAKLHGQSHSAVDEDTLGSLQQAQDNSRQASWQIEQWLKCQYMEPLVGKTFNGTVSQVNSNGFSVRLDEHLIEGFVETRLLDEKYSFDPMRLRLSSKSQTIELGQAVTVTVQEVNSKLRSIRYTLPKTSPQTTADTTPKTTTDSSGDTETTATATE